MLRCCVWALRVSAWADISTPSWDSYRPLKKRLKGLIVFVTLIRWWALDQPWKENLSYFYEKSESKFFLFVLKITKLFNNDKLSNKVIPEPMIDKDGGLIFRETKDLTPNKVVSGEFTLCEYPFTRLTTSSFHNENGILDLKVHREI